ncbi:MAG: PQQ-binding-like beta-propeller repeat protein [Sedimentisphaerales bacterium]|nr:PQQ-binding-like beta-propeller repeat protein [Sedimentisphaerales bacterium]
MKNSCLIVLFIFVFLAVLPATSNAVIGQKLLKEAGLETVWENAVALNPKEKVERMIVEGDYIFILTDNNYIFCLEKKTGRLNFAFTAALLGMPVLEPRVNDNKAYIVAANYLIVVDLVQGMEVSRSKIPFSTSSSIAVNDNHLYIPARDKGLHVSNLEEIHEIFRVTADDASQITSVSAMNDHIFFATDSGIVVCMEPNEPKRIWQFEAVGAVTAPLAITKDNIYISSKDTNLYQLALDSGKPTWLFPFHSGAALTDVARATDSTVYQHARNKGLYAIDAKSGKQIWLLADGVDLLSQDGDTAYVFDKNKVCIVMDNKSAKKVKTINFAAVTNFAANTSDSNIYVMAGKNISCLRPVKK